MSKILELRTKRNTLWEQTKDFADQGLSGEEPRRERSGKG